ncbi:hypothetical protein H6800_03455 [Candidatus Nomurabacteria bacterium]|nr:hypothetical protein [Candidatus Nomurabacteria bacterium]
MKVLTINRVRVGSLAKVVGVVQAVFGFVYGLGLTLAVTSNSINEGTGFVKTLGVSVFVLGMSVLFLPVVGYVLGWIQGALAAVVLNFIFAESKGLELEVDL